MAIAAWAELARRVGSRQAASMAGLTVIEPSSGCLWILPDEVLDIPIAFVPNVGPGLYLFLCGFAEHQDAQGSR